MSTFVLSAGCTEAEVSLLRQAAATDGETPLIRTVADLAQAHMLASLHRPDLAVINAGRLRHDAVRFMRCFHADPTCADIPLLAVLGEYRRDDRAEAVLAGATDIITSPLDPYECRARVLNLLTLGAQRRRLRDVSRRQPDGAEPAERQREWARDMLLRLARAGTLRSEEVGGHIARIGRISRAIARRLELPESQCDVIGAAAPMHDIGKIGIPDAILHKPGPLTPAERKQMETHTVIGYELLKGSPSPLLECGAEIALAHHEKYDGTGYPRGTRGEAIPLCARIVAVADVYDALSSGRSYKESWPAERVAAYLHDQKGRHFDPRCVDALFAELDRTAGYREDAGKVRPWTSSARLGAAPVPVPSPKLAASRPAFAHGAR